MTECQKCHGTGVVTVPGNPDIGTRENDIEVDCEDCGGYGEGRIAECANCGETRMGKPANVNEAGDPSPENFCWRCQR